MAKRSPKQEFFATEQVGSVPSHIVERRIEARDRRSRVRKLGAIAGAGVALTGFTLLTDRAKSYEDHVHEPPKTLESPQK